MRIGAESPLNVWLVSAVACVSTNLAGMMHYLDLTIVVVTNVISNYEAMWFSSCLQKKISSKPLCPGKPSEEIRPSLLC